jgi:hypothetical protein
VIRQWTHLPPPPRCPRLDIANVASRGGPTQREIMVSVITNRPSVPKDEIAELIAPWLDIEPTSLVLRQLRPLVYLLVMPCM